MILLQAISNSGSISANWVLVVVASICGFLGILILSDIRNSIKTLIERQNIQEKEITKTAARTDFAHERIDGILKSFQS